VFEGFETFGEIACRSVGYADNVMIACFFECKHIFFTFGDDESGDGFLGYLQTKDQDQLAARRYLADQGISLKTAIEARIGCLTHRCYGKDEDNKSTGTMRHCVAYVSFLNGQPLRSGKSHR